MKWFFALNHDSPAFAAYADMARVAVYTAQKVTSLKAHMLWDGPLDAPLLDWMRDHGVVIHAVRTRLYDSLARTSRRRAAPELLAVGAGAFLRSELPRLGASLGFGDETVLYTDCDVMFLRDPSPVLTRLSPRLFAVAPEFDPANFVAANTGVMLMRLPALQSQDKAFMEFTRRKITLFTHQCFDQGAYLCYYNPPHRWLTAAGVPQRLFYQQLRANVRLNRPLWDYLPPGLNWKPYWGPLPSEAPILHFHGPKPTDRARVLAGETAPLYQRLASPEYWHQCDAWDQALAEATRNAPVKIFSRWG